MQHEKVQALLDEYNAGVLAEDMVTEVKSHLALCDDCRQTLMMIKELGDLVAVHGQALFDEHPNAEELVALVEHDDSVDQIRLAQIRIHLRICPTCRRELELTQQAYVRLRNPVQRLRGAFEHPVMPWAIAAGIIFLMALVGKLTIDSATENLLAENRNLIERVLVAEKQVDIVRESLVSLADWSGALTTLFVTTPHREGVGDSVQIALQVGQPYLPVLFDFEPGITAEQEEPLEVRLIHVDDEQTVWRIQGTTQDWWDPLTRVLSLSIPVSGLKETTYRLELMGLNSSLLLRGLEFRLIRQPGSEDSGS